MYAVSGWHVGCYSWPLNVAVFRNMLHGDVFYLRIVFVHIVPGKHDNIHGWLYVVFRVRLRSGFLWCRSHMHPLSTWTLLPGQHDLLGAPQLWSRQLLPAWVCCTSTVSDPNSS